MSLIYLIPFCILFYFVGNLSPAKLFAKLNKKDLSKVGSGSAGATNTLRAFGAKVAIMVLVIDILKGVIPALIGMFVFRDSYVAMLSLGLATVIGHCFPIISKFKGGKGAATIVGVFLVVSPIVTAVAFTVGFITHCVLKQQSIASIGFVAVVVIYELVNINSQVNSINQAAVASGLFIAVFALVLFTHRSNMTALFGGTEKRVSIIDKLVDKIKAKKKIK
ncbi:MAG: glycerol-3-phosphate acyltransferase [Firmicutes bacterium]|nr:glycerol-3-phosphate acyltransferase [Bacillota bacterium]